MLKVHEVKHEFDVFIKLSEIPDTHRELKDTMHKEINYMISEMKYIQFQGSFGIVLDLNGTAPEWLDKFKELLPTSTTARNSTIAVIMD